MVARLTLLSLIVSESAKYANLGTHLLSAGGDRVIHLWNPFKVSDEKEEVVVSGVASESHVCSFKGAHAYDVLQLDVSRDSRRILSTGGDRIGFVWDTETQEVVSRLKGHLGKIPACCFFEPSGMIKTSSSQGSKNRQTGSFGGAYATSAPVSIAITGSTDKSVRVWDIRAKGYSVEIFQDAADSITAVAASAASEFVIYATSLDGCLYTYDLRKGLKLCDHIGIPVLSLSLSSLSAISGGKSTNSNTNVIAGMALLQTDQSILRLFDLQSARVLASFSGHKAHDYSVQCRFYRNDKYVVSGSEDGGVYFWPTARAVDESQAENLSGLPCHVIPSTSPSATSSGLSSRSSSPVTTFDIFDPESAENLLNSYTESGYSLSSNQSTMTTLATGAHDGMICIYTHQANEQ